ncbi:hypothetical protein GTO91_15840 [Heliobacterium undosum]|uniref:Uncharacterized protein n=1 Tax=Heliomicrobium undosum TaxID=121734 RepID=A0A845L7C2_9FIRM|nr:hypothetical protein [Heliomicrobium undosum]MZP31179.1 hypothetical protein [Heliomicrobium undosum]
MAKYTVSIPDGCELDTKLRNMPNGTRSVWLRETLLRAVQADAQHQAVMAELAAIRSVVEEIRRDGVIAQPSSPLPEEDNPFTDLFGEFLDDGDG